eukprot:CAMPEP_0181469820 /NCGR_PEP_ID=MMETSP1110-20121109/38223_1 /TAXON_ID=174948 /ORGANISM="Symbiodinium sp., Strain CCMP421" /LENGTH=40 /DNA_ID= /DNA_START= /DNA_END= /DNA_ORIENTATION=
MRRSKPLPCGLARRLGMQNGKRGELSRIAPEHFNTKAYAR